MALYKLVFNFNLTAYVRLNSLRMQILIITMTHHKQAKKTSNETSKQSAVCYQQNLIIIAITKNKKPKRLVLLAEF